VLLESGMRGTLFGLESRWSLVDYPESRNQLIEVKPMSEQNWAATHARWIWLSGQQKPDNAFVQFRKAFELGRSPAEAIVHVSADCRYLLFVNGEVVGRGPVTTDPRYKQVDVYDVATRLTAGVNVIAALVLQRHAKTSRLWPVRGGFVLQFDSAELSFGSDETWKARWASEYEADPPFMTHQYGHQEWLDTRQAEPGWLSAEFDDRHWQSAVVVSDSERYWPKELELRTVPHMRRIVRCPTRMIGYFSAGSNGRTPQTYYEPAKEIQQTYVGSSIVVWNADAITEPERGPVVLQENSSDGLGLVVDLGQEMYGYPFIEFEAPAGVVVDLAHGEALGRNRVVCLLLPESAAEQRYADRYTSRGGRQRWEIFDTKGARYLEAHFRNLQPDEDGRKRVKVFAVGMVESAAPVERETDFSCSDELMNRIFGICRRTMEVKNQDWHICDAAREQNMWIEPFQEMMHLQMFGRHEMHRQTLRMFARGQLADGFIPSTIPSIYDAEQTAANQYIFPTYTYPLVVYLDWLYGGPDPRHEEMLCVCERIFDVLFAYIGSEGVPRNTPGSHWCEWSGIDTRPSDVNSNVRDSWEVTFFAGHLVLSLECAARMAKALGKTQQAKRWLKAAREIRAAANRRYWSPQRRAYIDGIYDGRISESVSQTTNAMAVLARLGDEDRLHTALRTVCDPAACDVPSQVNQTTFFHEALAMLDMDALVPAEIRRLYGKMLEAGATTTWESEFALERSMGCCFGFAAHPLWTMVHQFLGVVPLEPGHRVFSVRVAPHDLAHAQGRVATPHGYIEVSWRRTAEDLTLDLVVPADCQAVVAPPRISGWQSVSAASLDGALCPLVPHPVAVSTYTVTTLPALTVGQGPHHIRFDRG